LLELADCGNINCKSDLQVAVRCIEAGVQGARHNVEINLGGINDTNFKMEKKEMAHKQVQIATENRDKVLEILAKRI